MRILLKLLPILSLVMAAQGCATLQPKGDGALDGGPTVVFISGANATEDQLDLFRRSFPDTVFIVPELYFPIGLGARVTTRQILDRGVRGPIVLVGHSWGGLLARTIEANNPGLVEAVVTIATPNGNFRHIPEYLTSLVLTPFDGDSTTPLFVVAGVKPGAERRWWMFGDDSDGVVDLASVTTLGKREVKALAVFQGDHSELLRNPEVIGRVRDWIQPEDHFARAGALWPPPRPNSPLSPARELPSFSR